MGPNIKRSLFSNETFDPHVEPHDDVTAGQVTFFLIWSFCFFLWVFRSLNPSSLRFKNSAKSDDIETPINIKVDTSKEDNDHQVEARVNLNIENTDTTQELKKNGDVELKNFSSVNPPPTFDKFLKCVVILGVILFYFFLCDYRKIFPKVDRVYNRDTFLFLVFLLFLVACSFTIQPSSDKILNRDQTEEWKGWMQVMFVWYHVFAAKEWYNWIRVYIAAYVWMTGFGNFSFFWVRKDFSLWRFLKMMFRLNFLVTLICVVTSNQYMLYYICAMHSYWFLTVYIFMGTLKSWNTNRKKMAFKLLAYFVFNCVIFEVPVILTYIFKPLGFLLKYTDPRFDPMHEWSFRAGLDHWACFIGMLCAYNYPHYETFLKNLEKSSNAVKKMATKTFMIFASCVILIIWYVTCMLKEKLDYNSIHPYTSFIPIICFIVIRNSLTVFRQHYIAMFAWLGKITLETYLSQLHIYLQSNAKDFIGYIPHYPLLNFSLATIIYLPISYLLFNLTTDFSAYLLPKDLKLIAKNTVITFLIFGIPYTVIVIWIHFV